MDFAESLKTVKPFSPRTDFTDYVPTEGVSLKFILKHLGDLQQVESMYDLEDYVLGITKRYHCSFVELLQKHEVHGSCVMGKASHFVSFAYSTSFQTILDALEKFMNKIEADDIHVWISIFTINQHFGRSEGESAPIQYPQSWFKNAFETCIESIGNVLFVMSPIDQPTALQRLWCIYELYLTVLYSQCTLDVCLSQEDEETFIRQLLRGTESILRFINGVDAERAKSSNPAQEEKLRQRIQGIPGGYEAINNEVKGKLRLWFAFSAKSYIAENKERFSQEKDSYIRLIQSVGKMLREAGRLDEAEPFEYEALYECVGHFGNDHPRTASAMSNLALLLREQDKKQEAVELLTQAVDILVKAYGPNHAEVGPVLNNLATLQKEVGRSEEAVESAKRALEITKNTLGPNHPKVAIRLNNLAWQLVDMKRYDEAEALMREAVVITRNALGPNDPVMAIRLNNLGMLLQYRGRYAESEPFLEQALDLLTRTLGADHVRLAYSWYNLSFSQARQGKLDEAEANARTALNIHLKWHELDHQISVNMMRHLAGILHRQGKLIEARNLLSQLPGSGGNLM